MRLEDLYSTTTAAVYCGISKRTFKDHVFTRGLIVPVDPSAHSSIFTKRMLDEYLLLKKQYKKHGRGWVTKMQQTPVRPTQAEQEAILTTSQAADFLDMAEGELAYRQRVGEIPAVVVGHNRVFLKDDLILHLHGDIEPAGRPEECNDGNDEAI